MKLFFITVVTILCIAAASVGVYFAVSGNTSKTPVPSNLEKGQYIAYVAKDYEQNGEIKVHRIENEAAGKPTSYAVLPKNTVSSGLGRQRLSKLPLCPHCKSMKNGKIHGILRVFGDFWEALPPSNVLPIALPRIT